MADSDKPLSNPPAQTADPLYVSSDGTSEIISFGPYRLHVSPLRLEQAGRLVPLGDPELSSCELTVSRGVLLWLGTNQMSLNCLA
jgi:hypothetical protein